jgi:hypothetical protein
MAPSRAFLPVGHSITRSKPVKTVASVVCSPPVARPSIGVDVVQIGWTDVDENGFELSAEDCVDVWCPIVSEL